MGLSPLRRRCSSSLPGRTGVTAIVPAQVMAAGGQCAAALAVGNGYGKFT